MRLRAHEVKPSIPEPPVTMAAPVTLNLLFARISGGISLEVGGGAAVMDEELPSDNSMNGMARAVRASRAVDMAALRKLNTERCCAKYRG